jgi:hypothetical protein
LALAVAAVARRACGARRFLRTVAVTAVAIGAVAAIAVVARKALAALVAVAALVTLAAIRTVAVEAFVALAAVGPVVVAALALVGTLVVAAIGEIVVLVVVHVFAARPALLFEARAALAQYAIIMFGILQIIFGLHPVAAQLRVARHALVLFKQLRRIAALAIVLAVAVRPSTEILRSLSSAAATAATLSIIDQMSLPQSRS